MRFSVSAALPVLLLILPVPQASVNLMAQDYVVEILHDEETAAMPPFSITRVDRVEQRLRLFLATDDPDAVASLLATGALQTQLSDHQAEKATPVSLVFRKAVWCSSDTDPVYLNYGDPLPDCDGKPPARIEFFFEADAVPGPDCDLAIGQDPDFLWLIGER